MGKKVFTKAESLQKTEKRLQEEASYILLAKKLGIKQETINKMVSMFSLSKSYYDALKKEVEESGE